MTAAHPLHQPVLAWYAEHARDLPWRTPDAGPWSVMVSEFMLQQTPVARVLPAHAAWLERWPTPAALAEDSTGEAVRMWGRLGYPRRALRLHACAVTVVERFDGRLPATVPELLTLPGVGDYTARAVVAFAHRRRVPVVDTSNPFIARDVPNADESMLVIRFRNPKGIDMPYLLSMLHDSFMSRANTIVCPGGKMPLAMQLIFTPMILQLMDRKKRL